MARKSNRIAVAALLLGVCTAVAQQRQQKISELPATLSALPTDVLPLVHQDGSTANKITISDLFSTLQVVTARGAANGYAPLDSSAKVPFVNLPPFALSAWTQTGSGMVARTLDAKLRDEPPTAYDAGAVGDGVTDDTTALQRLVNSVGVNGGKVRLPAGNYYVTAPITVGVARTFIEGDDIHASKITFNPASSTLTQNFTDGVISGATTITSATAFFTRWDNGLTVTGTGIPGGTTLTFVSATQATLSNASTNASGVSFHITGRPVPVFLLKAATQPGELVQCRIEHLAFEGQGTATKVGVELWDNDVPVLNDLAFRTWTSGNGVAPSVAIRIRGRDIGTISKITANADRPISIEPNPDYLPISLDHFVFRDLYLQPQRQTEAAIYFDPDCNITNVTFEDPGTALGQYLIYWPGGGTTAQRSINLKITNSRKEQGNNSQSSIYIDHYLDNLVIENFQFETTASSQPACYLRQVANATLQNTVYPGTSVGLDIDGTSHGAGTVFLINCFWQLGATFNTPGYDEAFALQPDASTGNRVMQVFEPSASGRGKNIRIYGHTFDGTLASLNSPGALADTSLSSNVPLLNAASWPAPEIDIGGYDNLLSSALGNCTGAWVTNFDSPTIGFVTRPDGSTSTQMTSTTAGAMSARMILADFPAVTAGTTYTGSVEFQAAAIPATSTAVNIVWYDVTDTQLSATLGANTFTDNTTGWTQANVTGVAPTGAVKAQIVPIVNSLIAGSGVVHYFRRASIEVGSVAKWQAPGLTGMLTMKPGEITTGTLKDKMQLGGVNGSLVTRLRHGTATLSAGSVTVTDANVTTNTRIFPQRMTDGGTVAASYSVARNAGVGFTITAKDGSGTTQSADTSTLAWESIEP
jgi:hypothetical protein